jgi:hypothetical protein
LNPEPTLWATPPALFCDFFFFEIGFLKLFAHWLQTAILLISAFWVARITGVSHQHLAQIIFCIWLYVSLLSYKMSDLFSIVLKFLKKLNFFFFFLVGLDFELRALHFQSRCLTTGATPSLHFALVILEMGSCELFAWTDLEPWSFWSQPSK